MPPVGAYRGPSLAPLASMRAVRRFNVTNGMPGVGLANVTVVLTLQGSTTPIATAVTDANGNYTFTGLETGLGSFSNYTVTQLTTGSYTLLTSPQTFSLAGPDQQVTGVNFDNVLQSMPPPA